VWLQILRRIGRFLIEIVGVLIATYWVAIILAFMLLIPSCFVWALLTS